MESTRQRSLRDKRRQAGHRVCRRVWDVLAHFTDRRWASVAIAVAILLAIGGYATSRHLQIGDLDPGAPELRADSVYNRDNAFVTANYRLSSDVFAVIVKTPAEACLKYETLQEADALAWKLQQIPGVQTAMSLADAVRQHTAGSYER